MTVLSDYVSGTISLTNGSVDFTGSATGWLLAAFKEGDTIIDITGATEFMGVIAEITSNTAGKLTKAWEGPNLVDAPYRMRYQADGSRVSAQARNLIELLGDGTLTSLAGLTGPGVIELLPGGGAQVVPKTDLVSGANYDVQVSDLAGRAVYDGQAEGFSVLVADVGDGRSAIYSKASNASADWTDPAYVTGPIGETPDVTVGTVTTGAPGTDVEVTATPITGGVELDFTIPAGEGFSAKGAYSGATAYALGDVVRDAGSSWIALQATTGNAPPTLPTTSNAYWELLAQKGQDGTGTGDVVGPASAVNERVAVWDGLTGKLLKDGGKTIAQILAEAIPAGYDDLQFTVTQIALAMADALNVAQFLGPSGNRLADSFDALTYVDVAGATNLNTGVAGVLKPSQAAGIAAVQGADPPTTGPSTGWQGSTHLTFTTPLSNGSTYVTAGAFLTNAGTINIKIVKRNSSTNVDVVATTGAVSHPGGGWADFPLTAPFVVPASGDYFVGFYMSSNTSTTYSSTTRSTTSGDLTGSNQTISAIGTGSGLSSRASTQGAINNLTVRSAAFTAAAVPTKMKALINVKEVDAAVAGTDYTLECSRDNGTTWTAMTLTERYTMPTTGLRVVEAAETGASAQPSGTAPRWRFKTLNNKNVELHDVYLYWS